MTKHALIEQLAREQHRVWNERFGLSWDRSPEEARRAYCEVATGLIPVIVAFVADFILTECAKDIDAATCAQRWREAMQ